MRPHPIWIYAKQIARWKSLGAGMSTRALIVNLEDPVLAPLLELAPTPWDLSDERAPLAGPKHYFLKRRALLRHLVALRSGCAAGDVVIRHDSEGAPRVIAPDAGVFVSVSARGSFAGLAISDAPVGVDVEISGKAQEPVWDVLHPSERPAIERSWREQGHDGYFTEIWIAKEAYLKALGTGLKRDPATLAAGFYGPGLFEVRDDLRPEVAWQGLWDAKIMGKYFIFCACIALDGRPVRTLYDF